MRTLQIWINYGKLSALLYYWGNVFFTVVTEHRAPILANEMAYQCIRDAFRYCLQIHPFRIDAMVMLPDHIHAIWTLPKEDYDYSKRWGIIKKHFTQSWLKLGGYQQPISKSKLADRRRGVWQKRFWEHTVRDQQDYNHHIDYIHYNPVKHGFVHKPADWKYSSLHSYIKQGILPENWGESIIHIPEQIGKE